MNAESGRMPGDKPTIRVLVVDDHPIGRLLLQGQLKALGYDVELAEEGNAALQRFAEAHYDVVMTDLNMPGMDGCSLARNLRSRGVTVPILAFTATANDAERKGCAAAGIDALFTKPLMIEAVDATVRRLIGATVASGQLSAKSNDLTHGPLPPKVHELLRQSFHQSIQAIDEALSRGDMQVVRDHLHSLRGSFAMIRELETVDMLGRMEQQAAANGLKTLRSVMPVFAEHALSVLKRRT
jgi:two-component system capsular synthesis sensor histidine kinase RcsC